MRCISRISLRLYRLRNPIHSKHGAWLLNNFRFCSTTDDKNQNVSENDGKVEKDSEDNTKIQDERKKAAKDKLMSLLSDMTASKLAVSRSPSLQLSKPEQHPKKKSKSAFKPSEEIISAVKDVASLAGSEAEKIEAELTQSIQSISLIAEEKDVDAPLKEDSLEFNAGQNDKVEEETMEQSVMASVVEAVAASVSDAPEEIQSELTKKLLTLASKPETEGIETDKLKNIFQGMIVERKKEAPIPDFIAVHKTAPEKFTQKTSPPPAEETVDLFGDTPLNIFTTTAEKEKIEEDSLEKFWTELQEKELKSLVTFAPTNAFQEMIRLTEQGKHWKFPIDNFSDIGPEENVGFHEHVFLEHHLHGFPQKGPVRHFMELVCVGLSKNPYITVERKIQNIDWYREYFKEKEHILKEYGVIEESMKAVESKQLQ